jgi:hypothetical protein
LPLFRSGQIEKAEVGKRNGFLGEKMIMEKEISKLFLKEKV